MRSLYLVTHPEATHVVERLVGGWYDSDLTPRGIEDARRIAEAVRSRVPPGGPALLFSSDLRRTRRTAEAIGGRLEIGVVLDAGLRERSYGAAEGRPVGTLGSVPPPVDGDRLHYRDGIDGSETRHDVATRIFAAVDRILAEGAEHSVVVTHGGAATFMIAAWIGMPLESVGTVKFKVAPGSISVLREDDAGGDRQVVSLNETAHLA